MDTTGFERLDCGTGEGGAIAVEYPGRRGALFSDAGTHLVLALTEDDVLTSFMFDGRTGDPEEAAVCIAVTAALFAEDVLIGLGNGRRVADLMLASAVRAALMDDRARAGIDVTRRVDGRDVAEGVADIAEELGVGIG